MTLQWFLEEVLFVPMFACRNAASLCGSNPLCWIFIMLSCFILMCLSVSPYYSAECGYLWHCLLVKSLTFWTFYLRSPVLMKPIQNKPHESACKTEFAEEQTRESSELLTFSFELFKVPLWTHPCRKIDSKFKTFYMDDMRHKQTHTGSAMDVNSWSKI